MDHFKELSTVAGILAGVHHTIHKMNQTDLQKLLEELRDLETLLDDLVDEVYRLQEVTK